MPRLASTSKIFLTGFFSTFILFSALIAPNVQAESKEVINIKVKEALARFNKDVGGAAEFIKTAKGVLVFPEVYKAGFGIGGEYGEGALLINGKTVDYYNTAAASIGLQFGAQMKTVIVVFLQKGALDKFRKSDGWEAGVDGSVALATLGAGASIDSTNFKKPIVGFIFGNKGLMYNLTHEGSKYTKLEK